MRVTDNVRLLTMMRSGQVSSSRLNAASAQAASGAKVNKPSDDPVAYATVVRRDADIASVQSRSMVARNAADGITIAENTLDSASTVLETAMNLAVQGANESLSPSDRNAIALQVKGLRDQLISLANTKGDNGYMFGGTKTDTQPFDSTTAAFAGNDGATKVAVTDGVAPRGNVSGARAFTAVGGRDVFADLSALQTSLETGDVSGIRGSIDNIRAGHEQIVGVQVEAGLSIERLQSAADVLDASAVSLSSTRSRAVGADDPAALFTNMSAASTAYQQSLEVTRRLLSLPSLATM